MAAEFRDAIRAVDDSLLRRTALEMLQVNLGNMCNQRCLYCHVDAGPTGEKIMPRRIMDDILSFLSRSKELVLDTTGGCPELNPNFRYFVEKARRFTRAILVRSNLTVMLEAGMEWLPLFYKDNGVKLICSLPCYTKENVDRLRGEGVFDKSIRALRLLNELGYALASGLEIDLVYNPGGAFLPGRQADLEEAYRKNLLKYGIIFNHLITITNAPISRFKNYLQASADFDAYMKLLMDSFNPDIAGSIMCRNLLSVGWDGILYDCDFNQALGLGMRDGSGRIMEIKNHSAGDMEGRQIIFENHCYCCTAGNGSSCSGALS